MTIMYRPFIITGIADQEVSADKPLVGAKDIRIHLIGILITPHTHETATIYVKDQTSTPSDICGGIPHAAIDNYTNMIPLDHSIEPGRTVIVSARFTSTPYTIVGCYVYTETPAK